jgi:hypothetical protein
MLRKMTLWYVVFAACLSAACAEEFGITRRTPAPQPPQQPSQQVLPYVVRIIAFDPSGQSFGTGSYVGTYGEYGIIVTNWHVVSETDGLVHVHFPESVHFPRGFSSFGARIKRDDKWDLALIAISKPPSEIPTLPIAQTPSKPGDPLWIVGFGSGWKAYRIAAGECVRYMAPEYPTDGTAPLKEILEVSVSARKGDSGGPILNQKGELAGVLFGSDMVRNTAGSYSERVNHFYQEGRSEMELRLPSRPETYFASIEKNGPLHDLRESRNAAPQNTVQNSVQQRSDFTGSSASSFGVRSPLRRNVPVVQPVSVEPLRVQPQVPSRGQGAVMTGMPLSALQPMREIEPAIAQSGSWAEASPKFGTLFPTTTDQSTKVVQTAHLIPLESVDPVLTIPSVLPTAADRYRLKLYAERRDHFFTLFLTFNACFAVGLTCYAVRLLKR